MTVKGNHPLAEVIACKLFGISGVPRKEQERMINRACKAAVKWYEDDLRIDRAKTQMLEALKEIAKQHKSNEWEYEGDTVAGYDGIIDMAREAIKAVEGE